MTSEKTSRRNYSQFACIGTGFSAICLGATLKRWYGISDIQFFERYSELGGTWFGNKYPGCACDVPSALYSYSFEPNPNWSRVLPSHDELWRYLKQVADKYHLPPKMSFGMNVEKCEWIGQLKRWRLHVRHINTDNVFIHECPIFHSSKWRHDVELEDKNVVVFGNGCTAAQIVPSIVGKTKHLTQLIRSKHWILPPIDGAQTDAMRNIFKYIPGTMTLQRFLVFLTAENELRGFPMTKSAAKFRQNRRKQAEQYMRRTAPEKYHGMLIPDFEVGCKRRIFDSGYLEALNSKNFTLTNTPAMEIVANGVQTEDGFVEADVIVMANGYITNKFLGGIEVVGRNGTLDEHWDSFGGAEAYNCSSMSGFPNFFILLGPNAATGHTSAIMAAENSVNFALRSNSSPRLRSSTSTASSMIFPTRESGKGPNMERHELSLLASLFLVPECVSNLERLGDICEFFATRFFEL
ncbi:uncharacterized protein NECHADRAFT_91586 [Fusarium vanettenii 77-13-4]|uniref:Uncharacterized protein n=1 Tax=Fusarium vanettenii (strain ATCC MYA-4622 / CBS 123669 / FGSC 9596 / NRRL 45880 / 77-13-4) TaxID=660122 RepID=C7ZJH7_FUSV7|nr:uncharacterized protein NECHADRAFT_91586 [Fusarium vanettenii 77-13-4]EEU35851.1 hypothetical protein NECHADRAFT_91586 [Fusarium vanettenii 77-13-4]